MALKSSILRDLGYLEDILESARSIRKNVTSMTREQFHLDENIRDAVVRRFEVIVEASKRVSDTTKAEIPANWKELAGFRDFLAHNYDTIDYDIVWDSAVIDLPDAVKVIESYVAAKQGD